VFPLLKSLFDLGFILISEEIKDRFKPKRKSFIELAEEFQDEQGKRLLLDSLNRAPKQQDAVIGYIQLRKSKVEISKSELIEVSGVSSSIISSLIEKGVFVVTQKVVSRFDSSDTEITADFQFNSKQQKAYELIQKEFEQKDVVLLHGVTASGKTQIYIRLIEDVIRRGKMALFLLPEIALTAQITERL